MSDSKVVVERSSGGIGVKGVLAVVFILCKIFGVAPIAAWSWWWVLAPIWIPLGITCGVLVILFLILVVSAVVSNG